ncbi:MAG: S1 RNA-binding domain-containing protein [Pseudomonadota bacterium]
MTEHRFPIMVGDEITVDVLGSSDRYIDVRFKEHVGRISIFELVWNPTDCAEFIRTKCAAGSSLEAKVISTAGELFYASVRAMHPGENPWAPENSVAVGDSVSATVTSVVAYGFFLRLENGASAILPAETLDKAIDSDLAVGTRLCAVVSRLDEGKETVIVRLEN